MLNQSYQQLGDYRLGRLLGEGTSGDVYLSEHPLEKRPVAVKVLKVQLTPKTIKMLFAEARMIRLKHPHILQLLDFDIDKDIPFLVMDYAPYGTLRQRHPQGTCVPLPIVCSYVKQIADALQYAHEHRLVHRDVKPSNMLIGAEQQILVSDFGIAVVAHSEQSLVKQDLVGTVPYIAPEQIQGKPRPASDQYALGIMVYEWLCGARPFEGASWEIAEQHLTASPPPLSGKEPTIPAVVEAVVMKALSKDPHKRFADVRTFAQALEQAAAMTTMLPQVAVPPASRYVSSESAQDWPASSPIIRTDTAPPASVQIGDTTALQRLLSLQVPIMPSPVQKSDEPPTSPQGSGVSGAFEGYNPVLEFGERPTGLLDPRVSGAPEARLGLGQSQGQPYISRDRPHLGMQDASFLSRRLSRRMVIGGGAAFLVAGGGLAWWLETHAPQSTHVSQNTHTPPIGTLLYTYRGQPTGVNGVAWSPDGKRIASGGNDTTVQVWNATNGSQVYTYQDHVGTVSAVAWSPDGKRIVSADVSGIVQVWNAADGGQVYTYRGHSEIVRAVAWSPDGKRIASGSDDDTVQVWNAADGSQVYIYQGHSDNVNGVAWSPDGKRIASGSRDTTVQVWNAADGSQVYTYRGHDSYVAGVAWSPDGKRIASVDDDNAQVWNAEDGNLFYIYTYKDKDHAGGAFAIAWSPDGKHIALGDNSLAVQVWDAADGSHPYIYTGHRNDINGWTDNVIAAIEAVAWSPNSKYIASGGVDRTVQVWVA